VEEPDDFRVEGEIVATSVCAKANESIESENEKWITLVSPYPVMVNGPELRSSGPNLQPQLREMDEDCMESARVSAMLEGAASRVVVSC
jgi:hypothetical protein